MIRINGNGSVRMIYSGTSTDATGADTSIGTSVYNTKGWDPTYVGYKYGEDLVLRETSEMSAYHGIGVNNIYYFGKGYEITEDGKFQLDQNQDMISGKWADIYKEVIDNYPYSCLRGGAKADAKCNLIMHVKEYVSDTRANVHYISYNSKDYASTLTNKFDSTVKKLVDMWYENNILNKKDNEGNLLSNYLSDEIFCNDRSIRSGDGYKLSEFTYYNMYNRMTGTYESTLLCKQNEDKFSVANKNLKYPIALITADEVMLAGGTGGVNNMFYLYTGQKYWTMSPSFYSTNFHSSYNYRVTENGAVGNVNLGSYHGVRPVINLSSEVEISQGIGTKDNPYVVKLKSS
ncbi:MAG: hypothetical protein E7161_01030 [Firmicutes bacterium]|nr:hypothetical protein [Bacillota bacterium]